MRSLASSHPRGRLVASALFAVLGAGCVFGASTTPADTKARIGERARFELDCQDVVVEVLYGSTFSVADVWYVGASGCGKRAVFKYECVGQLCETSRLQRTPIDGAAPAEAASHAPLTPKPPPAPAAPATAPAASPPASSSEQSPPHDESLVPATP